MFRLASSYSPTCFAFRSHRSSMCTFVPKNSAKLASCSTAAVLHLPVYPPAYLIILWQTFSGRGACPAEAEAGRYDRATGQADGQRQKGSEKPEERSLFIRQVYLCFPSACFVCDVSCFFLSPFVPGNNFLVRSEVAGGTEISVHCRQMRMALFYGMFESSEIQARKTRMVRLLSRCFYLPATTSIVSRNDKIS